MIIIYDRKFLKDLAKIPSKNRIKIERFIFKEISSYNNISEISKAEKLIGHKNYYKIRFGDYRVGIYYDRSTLKFERVLHRKEIYRFFPKTD